MRGFIQINVDLDDVVSEMNSREKQEMVDEFFEEGIIAKKDKRELEDDF